MRRNFAFCWVLSVVFLAAFVHAQVPIITTVGGGGTNFTGFPATDFPVNASGIGVDAAGNIYIATNQVIYSLDSSGKYRLIAGNGTCAFSGDGGAATSASVCYPVHIVSDAAGNLFISDNGNQRVREIDTAGVINTVVSGFYPGGLAFDSSGNLFIVDGSHNVIRKRDTSGNLTTVAGTGSCGYGYGPGPALSISICNLNGIAVDASGNVYLTENYYSGVIWLLDTSGTMTAFVEGGQLGDLAFDSAGNLLFSTPGCCSGVSLYSFNSTYGNWGFWTGLGNVGDQVSSVTPPSPAAIMPRAGLYGSSGFNGDGPATSSMLFDPTGIVVDSNNNLFINDAGNARVRKVDSSGNLTTIAGNGTCCFGGDGLPFAQAVFNSPFATAVDGSGNIYIADFGNQRIRKVDTNGVLSTIAGTGVAGVATPGAATSSNLNYPMAIAADSMGNLFIADTNNGTIDKVDSTGQLTILASISNPQGVAVDANGNVFFSGNQAIQRLDTQGKVTTVAGTGTPGFSGDGGSALAANLNSPTGVAVDPAGNIYVADSNNQRIRKIDTSGNINTIAGTGACYLSNDGPALTSALCGPFGLAYVASTGALLVSEPNANDRVRILYPSGNIKTVAGNGAYGFSGDGASSYTANLAYPYGIAVDTSGNILIADSNNQRIRKVTGAPFSEPPTDLSISQSASSSVVSGGANITYTLTVTNLGPNDASAITVTDNLPSSLSFVSCSTTGSGVCGGSGNNRTVSFDALPNGNSEVVTLVATVAATATGTINNSSTVAAGTPDSNMANNTAATSVTVGAATISISASSLNFGNQAVNTTSTVKSFTISNTGNAALTVNSYSLSGANIGDFSASSGTLPITLPPGTNIVVNVTFTPSAIGARSATLTVNSNAANGTQNVLLSGNGVSSSTTSLQSSLNPSYSGQSVTFTATVVSSAGGTPTGTVTFKDGTAKVGTGTLNSGVATFSTATLAAGTHSISATYSGDSNDLGSNSSPLRQVVNGLPAVTTTKLATSANPAFVQQGVTFTASITSTYGQIPDGEIVSFYDGTSVIGTGSTSGGSASFTTASLTAGKHTVVATYTGDANFKTSSGSVAETISLYSTSTTVSATVNPANYGQTIQLSATVSSNGTTSPTGVVTFKAGTVTVGSASLTSGVAVLSTAKLPVGSNSIIASYGGDALNGKSASSALIVTVNQAITAMTLSSSLNPSKAGQSVKFTVKVNSNGGTPTGSVTFMNGTTILGSAVISGGQASFSTSTLPQGINNITASYAGSAGYSTASATLNQTVN